MSKTTERFSKDTQQALIMALDDEGVKSVLKRALAERGFAVSGKLQFKDRKPVLIAETDLDGRSTLDLLKYAGIDTTKLTFVKPGEKQVGVINVDTANGAGFVYDRKTQTAVGDHHAMKGGSSAAIFYKVLCEMGLLKRSKALDRFIRFVTKVDNFQYPIITYDKQPYTILGLQRYLKFSDFLSYFDKYADPTKQLTLKQLEELGFLEAHKKHKAVVEPALLVLKRMTNEGKFHATKYGNMFINVNNELTAGAPAAYSTFDAILNITPGVSFFVGLKDPKQKFDESELRGRLGERFRGMIVRERMWLYNDENVPSGLNVEDIIAALQ